MRTPDIHDDTRYFDALSRLDLTKSFLDAVWPLRDGTDKERLDGAVLYATGVMRGDPATLTLGYSLGSALISAAELFNLDAKSTALLADIIATPKGGVVAYGPTKGVEK